MKVTLREKKLEHNRHSLYLDFYPPVTVDGRETRREFLRLYVFAKPKDEIEREHNKETRLLGKNIAAKRQLELQANPHGFISPRTRQRDFLNFFRDVMQKKTTGKSQSNLENWQCIEHYLTDYCGGKCTFAQINRAFVEGFRTYLLNCLPYKQKMTRLLNEKSRGKSKKEKLSPNSARSFFERFCAVVNEAHKQKLLSDNPTIDVDRIKAVTPHREFLLLEELRRLAATPCASVPDDLRRAALFSALTGLRHSDIETLLWGEVRHSKADGDFLYFDIEKTGEPSVLPISDEARELLGERGRADEKVFPALRYCTMTNIYIERWTRAAGIERRITFHAFRRTFATGQVTLGTDLYVVQRMLGHSDIRQTQIYAHLVDAKKREAAGKIRLKS
jgi:integrase